MLAAPKWRTLEALLGRVVFPNLAATEKLPHFVF